VHVELRSSPAAEPPGRVEIHVIDDGPGVPEHLRARIFEPFFTTKAEGTGLGLVMASEAAADQGGSLRLAHGGAGAHFVLTLPREPTGHTREFPIPDELAKPRPS
jgi:two-component system sensor histidine kinase PilS (NtrC family)